MDADVLLFGAPGEATVYAAIKAGLKHAPVDLSGKTAIVDLPALLSRCNLFIGNDSGAMHVAAAVGLPVVAGFVPSSAKGRAAPCPQISDGSDKDTTRLGLFWPGRPTTRVSRTRRRRAVGRIK